MTEQEPRRVLIMEDEVALVFLMQNALAPCGYHVVTCRTAESAMYELQKQSYDLLITDIRVPGTIDGLDLIKWQRRQDRQIPIIVVTAYSSPEIVRDLNYLKVDRLVPKPFDLDALVATVESCLSQVPIHASSSV